MTHAIREQYRQARVDQVNKNEARRIRTKVQEARNSVHDAGVRWPFELLQNAIDTGPRTGRSLVTLSFTARDSVVAFEHDGEFFSLQELAALLSGGSSKDFESEKQTGRFGTGFLVTHVLAEKTRLHGLIAANHRHESFNLLLDRGGDENAILENIRRCETDLEAATEVADVENLPSARFEYDVDNVETLQVGLTTFIESLPYLYSTRPTLGQVTLDVAGQPTRTWVPGPPCQVETDSGIAVERTVTLKSADGNDLEEYRTIRFQASDDLQSAAIVLLKRVEGQWQCCIPGDQFPRIFREYPIRGSSFVPTNLVFDGRFEVSQERDRLAMHDGDKGMLAEALDAAIVGVKCGMAQKWIGWHLLCRLGPTQASFTRTAAEVEWWDSQLKRTASSLAALPLIETRDGCGPAAEASADWLADFPLPRLDGLSETHETALSRIWPLTDQATRLHPPVQSLAADWCEIATGWADLGIAVNRVSLRTLADYVRPETGALADLEVQVAPPEWMAHFMDVVGECWTNRGGVDPSVLDGLLPNQNGQMCSPGQLRRDEGLSDVLKDIARDLGEDVRDGLFDLQVSAVAHQEGLAYFDKALVQAMPNELSEHAVLNALTEHLEQTLPDGDRLAEDDERLLSGTIRLLSYLWATKGADASSIVKKLPLLTADGKITRWTREKMLMAPVSAWPEQARPFSDAYPTSRVLSPKYCGDESTGCQSVVEYLVKWGIAIAAPLHEETAAELKDKGLAAVAQSPAEADGVTVLGERFPQIALLRSAVLNHVEVDEEAAKALLGLALCHIAPNDSRWRQYRTVKGRKSGQDVEIAVRDSLWISDLRSRAWVPRPGDDGKKTIVAADPISLLPLLDPAWLKDNDAGIELLRDCFGFDALDVRLLGAAPNEADRRQLRDGLARLIEAAGADPATYDSLRQEILDRGRRERDVKRCRKIGLAIQEAISNAIADRGLHVELIDRGFDLAVGDTEPADLDELAEWLQVGARLLEIKATTTGDARMTPKQAETASAESHRYDLCVVDLRTVPGDRLDAEWDASDVEGLAKIVSEIGGTMKETFELVEDARTRLIGIRNERALRYNVPVEIWEHGISIDEWVDSAFPELQHQTSPPATEGLQTLQCVEDGNEAQPCS